MKLKLQHRRGFTLVELLVVISIIALLAGIAVPVFTTAQRNAQIATATLQAGGIHKALVLYAQDYNGAFPTSEHSSNEATRKLFPDYLDAEKSFSVPNCPWHKSARNSRGPDDDIGNKPDYTQCLERGENHWAYLSGLNTTSGSQLPVIMDGFTETPGCYTDDPTKKGGVWRGSKAIIVFLDGSATAEKIHARDNFQVMRTKAGQEVDLFSSQYNQAIDPNNLRNPES